MRGRTCVHRKLGFRGLGAAPAPHAEPPCGRGTAAQQEACWGEPGRPGPGASAWPCPSWVALNKSWNLGASGAHVHGPPGG